MRQNPKSEIFCVLEAFAYRVKLFIYHEKKRELHKSYTKYSTSLAKTSSLYIWKLPMGLAAYSILLDSYVETLTPILTVLAVLALSLFETRRNDLCVQNHKPMK